MINLQKIHDEVISAFKENEDLFNAFKELREIGTEKSNFESSKKIFEVTNALCKKSKRIMLEDCSVETKSYYSRNNRIGINQGGLGTMGGYSSQLSVFNSRYRGDSDDLKVVKKILTDDIIFSKLIQAVNKNSVKDLKKLRNYYLNEKPKEFSGDFKIEVGDNLIFDFNSSGWINDIMIKDSSGSKADEYLGIREVHSILNNEFNENKLFENDSIEEMREFAKEVSDIELKTIKVFLLFFKKKKEIKAKISESIKTIKQQNKAFIKEDEFLSSILNLIKAFDNL